MPAAAPPRCGSAVAMTLPVLNATAIADRGEDSVVTKCYVLNGQRTLCF